MVDFVQSLENDIYFRLAVGRKTAEDMVVLFAQERRFEPVEQVVGFRLGLEKRKDSILDPIFTLRFPGSGRC